MLVRIGSKAAVTAAVAVAALAVALLAGAPAPVARAAAVPARVLSTLTPAVRRWPGSRRALC